MKEIRTTKLVEQTEIKFVADDGKEFIGENAERDCRDYEWTKDVKRVQAEFDRLNTEYIPFPLLDWFCCESALWKITLESKQDYYTMLDYFKVVERCYIDEMMLPSEFPYNMLVVKGYEDIYEYGGGVESLIEDTKKALAKLEG